jgi:hypothetical protein
MLPKVLATLLHTLFWAIPAWIIHPAAGAVVLALGVVTFFIDPTRFTWLRRHRSFWHQIGEVWRLLGTLFYWALGTAIVSTLAYLIRLGWEAWRGV